jgi:magnesium-transporting ATPase (P-type)
MFPADLILLSSTSEGGVAFIETASLDGEKNLKPRKSFQQTASIKTIEQLLNIKGKFEGNPP